MYKMIRTNCESLALYSCFFDLINTNCDNEIESLCLFVKQISEVSEPGVLQTSLIGFCEFFCEHTECTGAII